MATILEMRHIYKQVPGVLGVGAIIGIVMAANIGKGVVAIAGAAGPGMDVKGENRVAAGPLRLRQAGNMGRHKHAPAGLIKAHHSTDVRVLVAAPDLGNGRWPLSDAYKLIHVTHKVTSVHCMSGKRKSASGNELEARGSFCIEAWLRCLNI